MSKENTYMLKLDADERVSDTNHADSAELSLNHSVF